MRHITTTSILFLLSFIFRLPFLRADILAVILACNRSSQLKKTLRSLFALPIPDNLHIHVSIDANPKSQRALHAAQSFPLISQIWRHNPAPTYKAHTPRERIARHYHFVLAKAFDASVHHNITHVILLEDDLLFAPDFLTYILNATTHLNSANDNAIVCASAWNDNGRRKAHSHSASLTTFFPGLGWAVSRVFWESFLRPNWPASPTASERNIVGTGWDFWLRIAFDKHGWSCLIPDVSRVFHFGATGANVQTQEAKTLYSSSLTANVSADAVDWKTVVSQAANVRVKIEETQLRLRHGTLVASIADALQAPHTTAIMPYLREHFLDDIAAPLKLWPTPRGHFHHTLLIPIPLGGNNLLLYDARRAARRFELPPDHRDKFPISMQFMPAPANVSCHETCVSLGLQCTVTALEIANDCDRLAQIMPDRCKLGYLYETGPDLPAQVQHDAPLATAGMCLITETGTGAGGQLDCQGRFQWTTRACACVTNTTSITTNDGNYRIKMQQHDEL